MCGVAEVRHLVAHARLQSESAAVAQFGVELAFHKVEHVAPVAPVIGQIARRVLAIRNTDAWLAQNGLEKGGIPREMRPHSH